MRRSLAPSQRPAPPAAAQFSIPAPALAQRQGEGQGGGNNGAVVRFSAVWCKTSGRKHKKWEDDAILEIRWDTSHGGFFFSFVLTSTSFFFPLLVHVQSS